MEKELFDKLRIPIIEGFQGGDVFNIGPTNEIYGFMSDIALQRVCISVYEDDVDEFLLFFMKRHIHYSMDDGDPILYYDLEWWGEDDYPYSSMNDMLTDIEEHIKLLQNDYDNPCLDKLKKHLQCGFYYAVHNLNVKYEERENWVKENIEVAIDFYSRFIGSVRSMMKKYPNHKYIAFEGP